jgi:hypothetical protein
MATLFGTAAYRSRRAGARHSNDSPRQRDEIALQPRRFFRAFELRVNLMEVAAHAQEHFARTYRCQKFFAKSLVAVQEKLNAVGFRHEPATIENIHIKFIGAGLIAANEMSRHTDPRHGQMQPTREQQI